MVRNIFIAVATLIATAAVTGLWKTYEVSQANARAVARIETKLIDNLSAAGKLNTAFRLLEEKKQFATAKYQRTVCSEGVLTSWKPVCLQNEYPWGGN